MGAEFPSGNRGGFASVDGFELLVQSLPDLFPQQDPIQACRVLLQTLARNRVERPAGRRTSAASRRAPLSGGRAGHNAAWREGQAPPVLRSLSS